MFCYPVGSFPSLTSI